MPRTVLPDPVVVLLVTSAITVSSCAQSPNPPRDGAQAGVGAAPAQTETKSDLEQEKKAAEWVESLELGDAEKEARLEKVIATHLKAVRAWHNEHPYTTVPEGVDPSTGRALSDLDRQVIADSAIPKSVHENLMAGLHKDLNQEQVEAILDKYTIGKVEFTMRGYHAIVPDLTAEEEETILRYLKQAREQAVDYKNMKEISAIFEIYKTKSEQYLNANGRNWRQLYKDYVNAAKARKAQAAEAREEAALASRYPQASAVFDMVEQYPLIKNALLDDEYLAGISQDRPDEDAMRKRLADAAFRKFGDTRSVRVQLVHATTTDQPAIILAYQTAWKHFTSLPRGGPHQTDPVMLGSGRDSMWDRAFYGGTDDPEAHQEFEELLEVRRKMPSNRRNDLDPQFVKLAQKYLPAAPLNGVRANVHDIIERLVSAFKPYGAEVIDHPEYGNFGAKITDHLYLYIRDFPEDAPTRYEHDPFFWLIVSGGPKRIPTDVLPAFPGAQGMGAFASGGRGGRVIYVTNTNSEGPGSLKAALETSGPRIVLFGVSGQIDLPDQTWITEPNLTMIGYTAPGEGVEVNGRLCMAADNVILRGMRFRLRPPTIKDGMSTRGRLHNIIFDHCSFAYASDELLRMIGGESCFYGFTIQYCLLGPGLAGLGDHPYGPEIGGYGTFHHNLFYNTLSRSPEVDCVLIDWRYNIMANMRSGHSLRPHSRFNMVGNYIVDIPGNPNQYSFDANDSVYQADNLQERGDQVTEFHSDYQSRYLARPYRVVPVTKTDPRDLTKLLVPIAGAFLPTRDVTDSYFIEKFKARECKLPHFKGGVWRPYGNENDNMDLYEMWEDKNFPPPTAGAVATPDRDRDGMPDEWETANGLNPDDASDGKADPDKDGYSNVEEWLYQTNPHEYVDYTKPENNLDKVR